MQYRKFGKTGLDVSVIGIGCWAMGGVRTLPNGKANGWGPIDDEEAIRAIHTGLDRGINLIDTAESYGLGHSEEVVGRALAGRRDQAIVVSKLSKSFYSHEGKTYPAFGREHIREMVERSLKRLRTDVLDVYLWHEKVPEEIFPESKEAMEEIKREGKIRFYGASAYPGENTRMLVEGSGMSVLEPNYNILEPEMENDSWVLAEKHDLGGIARGALGMGILTGKFSADTKFADTDVRSHNPKFRGERFARALAVVDKLRPLARPGRSLGQLAIAWVLKHPRAHTVIVGARSARQVEENAAVGDLPPLTDEEMSLINEARE